jgi:hypothetical protein
MLQKTVPLYREFFFHKMLPGFFHVFMSLPMEKSKIDLNFDRCHMPQCVKFLEVHVIKTMYVSFFNKNFAPEIKKDNSDTWLCPSNSFLSFKIYRSCHMGICQVPCQIFFKFFFYKFRKIKCLKGHVMTNGHMSCPMSNFFKIFFL